MILITVILMDLLVGMEFDLFTPSFPALQSQFGLSPFLVEALLSINFIGYCLSLFFVGGLADRYGRKPVLLFGLGFFIIGSILCVWAKSYEFLLVGRFLQGIGIAAPAILSFLIIADAYPIQKQQFFLAMLNGAMNVSVAAAPILGSYIALYFHWQGNFIALLVLGLVVLALTLIFIPRYKIVEPKKVLLFSGYISLFKSKPLRLLMLSLVLMFVPYWIFVGMSPLLYMQDLGVSLSHFGYYQGILALVFALGSVLFGLIMHKYENKKMLYFSFKIYIASLISIALVTFLDSHKPLFITLAFLPFIIAQVIPTTLLYPVCLNFMPQAKGRASAILQSVRLIFSALGLQLAGYCYRGSFQNIGIIITGFIFAGLVTLFLVIKNRELMEFSVV